jgi:peptide/nickel transport system permease protein
MQLLLAIQATLRTNDGLLSYMQKALVYVLQLAFVLLAILTILFFLQRLTGDPAAVLAGPSASPEVVEGIREEMGLNEPMHVQYSIFLSKAVQLDFGESSRFQQPALDIVLERFPKTLILAGSATLLSLMLGVPLGIYAASYHKRADGMLVNLLAGVLQSQPSFFLGILLILFFAVRLGWFKTTANLEDDAIKRLVLPTITLASFHMARLIRLVRSSLIDEMNEPYVTTARGKGLSERRVWFSHALRNAIVPIIAFVTLDLSLMIGGSFVIENLFSYSGVGDLMINSVFNRDYAVVQATVFVITMLVVLINSLSNVMYRIVDPRINI